ncbi:MAG: Dihydroorotate dehydrogenase (quinone), mitochondrial [Geoglossum umbratile]|nr:MAG: Dihydroorotate dehydrogenase (quinone), mitochondrial [Geoglossum umbratile]
MKALRTSWELRLNPRERGNMDHGVLEVKVFGQTLMNPIAISAGIDKGGKAPTPLLALGPAIVEVGAITPLPQDGNSKPRLFRLPSQNALINRYGFNSEGADSVAMRLRERVRQFAYLKGFGTGDEAQRKVLDGEAGVPPGSLMPGRLMAVQIAKNKRTPSKDIEAVKQDYVYCMQRLGKYADIIVVNVSSPNTPGLRTLQQVEPLTRILKSVVDAAAEIPRRTKPRVMVKVSPDEDGDEQVRGICKAVWESGIDGVIVANTTNQRPDPLPKGYVLPHEESTVLFEQGGYSGPQLFEKTLALVKRYRNFLDDGPQKDVKKPSTNAEKDISVIGGLAPHGNPEEPALEKTIPPQEPKVIFASGGITNGKQALEVLNAGASVAMVNTALVYGGAGTITRIKREMKDEIVKGREVR